MTFHTRLRLPVLLAALLAVAALAALTGLPTPAAQAQGTEIILVSNTGQSHAASYGLTSSITKRAQAFTTGPNAQGYRLASVGFFFGNIDDTASAANQLTATINTVASSGNPGNKICTLTPPASYGGNSLNTYTVPTTCPLLAASTSYFVVIERHTGFTETIEVSVTISQQEDSGGADGWSVADDRYHLAPSQGITAAQTTPESSHRIQVKGIAGTAATGAPTVSSVREEVLLVGNTGQPDDIAFTVLSATSNDRAQLFTTGPNPADYTLVGVEIDHDGLEGDALPEVSLYTRSADGAPGTKLADLAPPSTIPGSPDDTYRGVVVYTAPANTTLSHDTSYFIVVRHPGVGSGFLLYRTVSDDEDSGKQPGWSLGNAYLFRNADHELFSITSTSASLKMNIRGTVGAGAEVGEVLAADTTGITDANGVPTDPNAFTYQWVRVDSGTDADITGATAPYYYPTEDDVGKTLKVKVSFTDDDGYSEGPLTSEASAAVAANDNVKVIWTSTLIATVASTGATGYNSSATSELNAGSLSDPDFDFDSTTYTVEQISTVASWWRLQHTFSISPLLEI